MSNVYASARVVRRAKSPTVALVLSGSFYWTLIVSSHDCTTWDLGASWELLELVIQNFEITNYVKIYIIGIEGYSL